MIGLLHKWIEQIAVAVIIVSIFEMILPNGKTRKYIKIILGIFVVFNIVSPFVNGSNLNNLNLNNIIENYVDEIGTNNLENQNSTNDKIEDLYIRELEKNIVNSVEELGYNVANCEIDAVVYEDKEDSGINSINISILSKKDNYTKEKDVETINQVNIEVTIDDSSADDSNNITDKDIKKIKKYLSSYYEIDKNIINIY